jgi:hypothetical protein
LNENGMEIYRQTFYELVASVTVPLSLVSFFASSDFFCAAICHAGMAARPPAALPYDEAAALSGVKVGVGADAGVLLPWASVVLATLFCSLAAGVDDACGAGVDVPEVPLTLGVAAGVCDWFWP